MNMRQAEAIRILDYWDRRRHYVYKKTDLRKLIREPEETFNDTLDRLVKAGILERPARNVYVYPLGKRYGDTLDLIARTLRRGELTYESLESALSMYGVISQIPVDRRTYSTTGRSGEYVTRYGVIEFTHTSLQPSQFLGELRYPEGRDLPVASKALAWRNLKSTRRNLHLVNMEEIDDLDV